MTDDDGLQGLAFRTLVHPQASDGEVAWAGSVASAETLSAARDDVHRQFAEARLRRVKALARMHELATAEG